MSIYLEGNTEAFRVTGNRKVVATDGKTPSESEFLKILSIDSNNDIDSIPANLSEGVFIFKAPKKKQGEK